MDETQSDPWKDLTADQVERSRAFFSKVARLAWSYSCSVLLGCPQRPTPEAKSGTGTFVHFRGEHFVVTAYHIVSKYKEMLKQTEHVHFQIADLTVNPLHRLAYADTKADVAVIAIAPHEAAAVGSNPYIAPDDWSPTAPAVGQQIQFCGYARINRVDGVQGTIDSTVLPLTAEIHNSTPERFSVHIERHKYRWDGECLLKPDQAFLGGMSGGPALLLNDPRYPLIGIVCEGNDAFDLVYFSPLSLVPWQRLVAQ